jgi:hypothetical protein
MQSVVLQPVSENPHPNLFVESVVYVSKTSKDSNFRVGESIFVNVVSIKPSKNFDWHFSAWQLSTSHPNFGFKSFEHAAMAAWST